MDGNADVAGLAALAICESMLLSLVENKLIDDAEARAILTDAATAHRGSIPLAANGQEHEAVARLIEHILKGGNSVRSS